MHRIIATVVVIIIVLLQAYCSAYQLQQPTKVTQVKPLSSQEYLLRKAEILNQQQSIHQELSTEHFSCGNDALLKLFPSKQPSHSLFENLFYQQQSTCPLESECDDPTVRDQYSINTATRVINVEFAVERGTTFASSASQTIPVLVSEMNSIYNPLGFEFSASIVEWGPLQDDSGDTLGNWYVSLPCSSSLTYTQPCYEHVGIVNKIFETRGGFRKNNTLVVLVAQTQRQLGSNLRVNGFAYFPWMPNNGLMVLIPEVVVPGSRTIQHEAGHSLGLWHIHRGTYEILRTNSCPNPAPGCYEGTASDITGDFCDDTGPFPNANVANLQTCTVPSVSQAPDFCDENRQSWSSDGVNNLMSYMPNQCRNEFSTKQARRMRCYVDRFGYPNRNSIVATSDAHIAKCNFILLLVISVLVVLVA